jgi:hypothetical protein
MTAQTIAEMKLIINDPLKVIFFFSFSDVKPMKSAKEHNSCTLWKKFEKNEFFLNELKNSSEELNGMLLFLIFKSI